MTLLEKAALMTFDNGQILPPSFLSLNAQSWFNKVGELKSIVFFSSDSKPIFAAITETWRPQKDKKIHFTKYLVMNSIAMTEWTA